MRGKKLPHFQKPRPSRSSSRPRCELAVNQKGFYFVSSIEIHVEIGETMDIYLFCVPCVSPVYVPAPPPVSYRVVKSIHIQQTTIRRPIE